MTKVRSPIEEHRVARMTIEDDAAKRECFWPGTLATHHTSDDRYLGVKHWNSHSYYCYCSSLTHFRIISQSASKSQ